MQSTFETDKNRKAFVYTVFVCGAIVLITLLIRWTTTIPPIPAPQDLIEVNLGNNDDGYGQDQPLIKGQMSQSERPSQQERSSASNDQPSSDVQPNDDENDKDAAQVVKTQKPDPNAYNLAKQPVPKRVRNNNPQPVAQQQPKPQDPLLVYHGPGGGKGNGATESNDKFTQGNTPGGRGDNGTESGNPDSYGTSATGRTGGPRILRGDRKIIRYYSFSDDLGAATINAIIKVSPDGKGTFAGFDKGSSTINPAYANSIAQHLGQVQFDKSDHESVVTVQFIFTVK